MEKSLQNKEVKAYKVPKEENYNNKCYNNASANKLKNKLRNILLFTIIFTCIVILGAIYLDNYYIILDFLITVFFYMAFPYFCIKSGEKYSKNQALKIAVINSIVVAIIFAIIRGFITDTYSISTTTAFVYGYMNYYLLKSDEKEIYNSSDKDEKRLNELIKNIENNKGD